MPVQFRIRGAPVGLQAILVGLLASVGGFIFGYDTGQISGFLSMTDFLQRFGDCHTPGDPTSCSLPTARTGLVVGLLSIGCLFGALVGSYLADFFGRTRAMSLETIIFTIGMIVQMTAEHAWYQIMIGRFIAGLAVGSLSAVVPVYQSECAPRQVRGAFVATYQLMITIGILIAYAFGLGTSQLHNSGQWRIVMGLGLIFAAILGVGCLFAPESPRWLLWHGRPEEALQSLQRIRGVRIGEYDEFVQKDFEEMSRGVEAERHTQEGTWFDCFRWGDKMLYRTLLGMGLQTLQQLTGANYFFYFGTQIFNGVGIHNPFDTQLILGAVNVISTFFGLYVMEKFGRRWPLIVGAIWQAAWLFVFAAVGSSKDPLTHIETARIMIASACMFILGFATTWGPGIWIVIGETFPVRTRTKQGALATASNWLWNFLLAFFTTFITDDIGYKYGYVFAGCNIAGCIVVFLFLYESANLPLEAVDVMYNDPNVKPWTSTSWVPKGFKSRHDLVATLEKAAEEGQNTMVGDVEENVESEKNQKGHGSEEGGQRFV